MKLVRNSEACLAVVVALAATATAAHAASPWATLDPPGSVSTTSIAINGSNVITGFYSDGSAVHGYVWTLGSGFTTFDPPNSGGFTIVHGMNGLGDIVGFAGGSYQFGFIRHADGSYETVTASGTNAAIFSINAKGVATGYSGANGFVRAADGSMTTFTIPNTNTVTPVAINGRSTITGVYTDTGGIEHGFVRDRQGAITSFDPPGSTMTTVSSMNDKGEITGEVQFAGGKGRGYLREPNGSFTLFDAIPTAGYTAPTSINIKSEIVGCFFDPASDVRGFVRDSSGNITLLDAPNASITCANSISPDGKIIGTTEPGDHGFRLNRRGWTG